ncbi:MAG: HXXEE domain-containing protein [Bacteroidetes bacterium]|nr:HXXEE domain-containing protein [Bacteroidota bacterium]
MNQKIKWIFLILVLVQGLHSIEEYVGKLWENFPPARVLCSLVSDNLVTGFLIINIGLFVFGLWCWLFPIRKNYFYAQFLIWFWIVLELINGIGHPIWTLMQKTYTPGMLTAPILLLLAIYLLRKQLRENKK